MSLNIPQNHDERLIFDVVLTILKLKKFFGEDNVRIPISEEEAKLFLETYEWHKQASYDYSDPSVVEALEGLVYQHKNVFIYARNDNQSYELYTP